MEKSQAKHTPGPWKIGRKSKLLPSYSIEIGAFTVYAPNKPTANLIAAAPELLEVCKKALNDYLEYCKDADEPTPTFVFKLQAAIRKATGGK